MPPRDVDQILSDGTVTQAPDRRLSASERVRTFQDALPGAEPVAGFPAPAMRYEDSLILYKQVTHLGRPWPGFKKRIQIPKTWLEAEQAAREQGLDVRFLGIYHYGDVTIFVDFDPATYVQRKANNSAAHVATNDLYQAQTLGMFSREDRAGNTITSVRADYLRAHLAGEEAAELPGVEVFRRFNREMLLQGRIEAMDAVREMYEAQWPDRFQGEWAGFYLEHRLNAFVQANDHEARVKFQKVKRPGSFDYDLILHEEDGTEFFGDLKASTSSSSQAPGNDAADLRRCVQEYGRFWYVVYEHDTWRSADHGDLATIEWNTWKWEKGFRASGRTELKPLSYRTRFKAAVDFTSMFVLEVNPANIGVVLSDFHQGVQPSGEARALKVMINKRNIENFLVYSERR